MQNWNKFHFIMSSVRSPVPNPFLVWVSLDSLGRVVSVDFISFKCFKLHWRFRRVSLLVEFGHHWEGTREIDEKKKGSISIENDLTTVGRLTDGKGKHTKWRSGRNERKRQQKKREMKKYNSNTFNEEEASESRLEGDWHKESLILIHL